MAVNPRHQLRLLILPASLQASAAQLAAAAARLQALPRVIPEGSGRVWWEHFEGLRFVSSGQGGFHVRCPATGENLAPAFSRALPAWRAGGERALVCPACKTPHALETLEFAPTCGFADGWLRVEDIEGTALCPEALEIVKEALGAVRWVYQRG